jgi:hypothetical protein
LDWQQWSLAIILIFINPIHNRRVSILGCLQSNMELSLSGFARINEAAGQGKQLTNYSTK